MQNESPDTFKPFWLEANSIRDIYKIGHVKLLKEKISRYFLNNLHINQISFKIKSYDRLFQQYSNLFWPNMHNEWLEFCKACE